MHLLDEVKDGAIKQPQLESQSHLSLREHSCDEHIHRQESSGEYIVT